MVEVEFGYFNHEPHGDPDDQDQHGPALPMLGREVVEGQQLGAVLDQAFGGLWVFRLEGFDEQIKCVMRVLSRFRLPNVMQHFRGLGLGRLGQAIQHVAGLVNPTALLTGAWVDLLQGGPEPHCAVAGGEFRGGKARKRCKTGLD